MADDRVPNFELDERITSLATPGVNEVQRVKVDATGGNVTYKLDGETTPNVAATATAAQLREALEGLSNVSPGDVTVTGGPGNAGATTPYLITFKGDWAEENVPTIVATGVSLTGGASTVVVETVTAGSEAVPNPNAVKRGTGLADRTADVAVLSEADPITQRSEHSADYS